MEKLSPQLAIQDLEIFLKKSNTTLSEEARSILLSSEELAYINNIPFYVGQILLYGVLCKSKSLRDCIVIHGGNYNTGIEYINDCINKYSMKPDNYSTDGLHPYSSEEDREYRTTRARIADYAIAIARRNSRNIIYGDDIVTILLDLHEEDFPIIGNLDWVDTRLHVDFNTISHILGKFDKSLWVKFKDVRSDLNLLDPKIFSQYPVENAPLEVRPSLLRLLNDFPDFSRNAFLIMPFRNTKAHREIYESISNILTGFGINVLRADNRSYSDDLLTNVLSYIHASRFGIAVYERILDDNTNPNVSFEVGYMLGLKKPVCLLKEETIKSLHTDLVGRVHVEFKLDDLYITMRDGIEKWLQDKRLPYISCGRTNGLTTG